MSGYTSITGAEKITAPYGSWKSPITADEVSGASKSLGGIAVDSRGHLIWLESRPSESGRGVLVREGDKLGGEPSGITPKEFSVRNLTQDYGGGAFQISSDDTLVFSNYEDQRLYEQDINSKVIFHLTFPFLQQVETTNEVVSVYSLDAEFTRPLWVFGINSYEIIESGEEKSLIVCSYRQKGKSYLGILDDADGSYSQLDIPLTDVGDIRVGNQCIYVEGASAVHPSSIARVTLDEQKLKAINFEIVWSCSPDSLNYKSFFSLPELIEFPTEAPDKKAYAYFYPPSNPFYQAGQEEKPPLLVESHGGPTAEARGILNLSIQYWTSRGWGFLDVNYGGSTGYGREYRERLLRHWGIVDVDDCCSAAKYLVESGKADTERLCINGGSAGGYTALAALAFRDLFKGGASLYGVADLRMLKAEIPKFESHYIDNLVGDGKEFYERSPINFVDKFSCPIIFFQGLEDKIVSPHQSRKIYRALKEKGLPVALVEYEGEQHGFRKAENIKFTLEQQMMFFARVVGHFSVADDITPIKIDNLD